MDLVDVFECCRDPGENADPCFHPSRTARFGRPTFSYPRDVPCGIRAGSQAAAVPSRESGRGPEFFPFGCELSHSLRPISPLLLPLAECVSLERAQTALRCRAHKQME